jgi:hypothetical protein
MGTYQASALVAVAGGILALEDLLRQIGTLKPSERPFPKKKVIARFAVLSASAMSFNMSRAHVVKC